MYEVNFISKRVEKEFRGFTAADQTAIQAALDELKVNPRPLNRKYEQLWCCGEIKKIKIGRIRVFYKIDEKSGQIWIGKLDTRDSHSYKTEPMKWFQKTA